MPSLQKAADGPFQSSPQKARSPPVQDINAVRSEWLLMGAGYQHIDDRNSDAYQTSPRTPFLRRSGADTALPTRPD